MRRRRRRRHRAVAAMSAASRASSSRQPIAPSALDRLRGIANVTINTDSSKIIAKPKLIAAVKKCDILFSLLHDKIDRAVLAANPKLRALASMSITPDNIDVAEATKRGIPVTVVPPIVTEATADIHFGLMIAVARRMIEGDRMVRAGKFPGSQSNHLAGCVRARQDHRPGRRRRPHRHGDRAARARLRHAAAVLEPAPQAGGRARDRHAARHARSNCWRESDFVSLHPPLNAETRHMISDTRIRADEADRLHHQYRARRHHRREGADARAEEKEDRRRRPRRVRARAECTAGACAT